MATLDRSLAVIQFEVFRGGSSRRLGLATVELPTIEYETVDAKGNGLGGTRSFPIRANTGDMELKLTWATPNVDGIRDFKYECVDLSLYGAMANYDAADGGLGVPSHRIETRVIPKSLNLGKFEPSSTADAETAFTVLTFTYYINGREMIDIDWANYICKINGDDIAAPVREALGL